MSPSLVQIYIHTVFSTKHREPLILPSIEAALYRHIREQLRDVQGSPVLAINGMPDHLHILFRLDPGRTVREVLHYAKGESSHWVNHSGMLRMPFAWQAGYGAFSVSATGVKDVHSRILGQKELHRTRTYDDECGELFLEERQESEESVPSMPGHE